MTEYERVLYEILSPGVVRITQNRPEARNAQEQMAKLNLDQEEGAKRTDQ